MKYMSISRIIYKTKNMYEKSFLYTEYDDNDLTYFILYNLRTMKKSFEELKQYLKRKTEENNNVLLLLHIKNVNPRQAQIIKIMKENPHACLLVKEMENRFSIGNQTARTDLYGLVKLGYLSEIQINKRKIAFVKSEKFDMLFPVFS